MCVSTSIFAIFWKEILVVAIQNFKWVEKFKINNIALLGVEMLTQFTASNIFKIKLFDYPLQRGDRQNIYNGL